MLLEVLCENLEESRMCRRIGRAKIIDRVDDPSPEEKAPHPVDYGLGKVGIIRSGHPFGQLGSRIGTLALRQGLAVEEGGPDFRFRLGMDHLDALAVEAVPAGGIVDDRRITPIDLP